MMQSTEGAVGYVHVRVHQPLGAPLISLAGSVVVLIDGPFSIPLSRSFLSLGGLRESSEDG